MINLSLTHCNNKAVFLDRDGVLNHAVIKNKKPYPPRSLEELVIFHDALESLQKLKNAGFLLICVTNQPDVARGSTQKSTVETINCALLHALPLNEIVVCYHDDHHKCSCRKPKPGMILEAAQKYNIDTKKSFMIGDRWRDIDAGHSAGCQTIWLNSGYDEKHSQHTHYTTDTIANACAWILSKSESP